MTKPTFTTVDFVARGDSPGEWRMVLVEEGPWAGAVEQHLRKLQDRLYGCIDAALDGELAAKFPDSLGARVIIEVDCYNLPQAEVHEFFQRFTAAALFVGGYKEALESCPYVNGIGFRLRSGNVN